MTVLKVAVLGVGALGQHHARILSQLPGASLVAVVEPQQARGEEIAAKLNTRWVGDYHEILDEVDAVSIVVPTVHHHQTAIDFLSRGIPVMIEKPLAATVHEARDLATLSKRTGTLLQVGHIERFNPTFQALLPRVGQPKYMRTERLAPFTFRSTDIGVVLDLMIHDIDLLLTLNPSPVMRVEAFGTSVVSHHEDLAQARLVFQNGVTADLIVSRVHPTASRSLQVWSSEGCFTADLHQRTLTQYAPTAELRSGPRPVELARQPGASIDQLKQDIFGRFIGCEHVPVAGGDALTAELSSFLDCVLHHTMPVVDGEQGLRAMQVADRVLQALAAEPAGVRHAA